MRAQLTLLQQIMVERRWTRNDTLKHLEARAATIGESSFRLSLRQLDRMLAGQVETVPYPSTCRVIEAEFGRHIEDLLSHVATSRPPMISHQSAVRRAEPVRLPPGAAASALHELLISAAGESAEYGMWQSVDQLCVDTLTSRLSQLARDYVCAEMTPVVHAIHQLRREVIELLPRAGGFGRSLYFIAGISSAMLAHAAGNLGHLHTAPGHVTAALRFAELGHHPVVGAWALGVHALQLEWSGHPSRSLDAVARAQTFLHQHAPCAGTTKVWLSAIEARAHARLQDPESSRRALGQVMSYREETAGHRVDEYDLESIGGILTFGEAKQHYYAAVALRKTGHLDPARDHAAAAIEGYEHGPAHLRSYGDENLARLDLAIAYAADQRPDLDAAAAALEPVSRLPHTMLLPTMRGHLNELANVASVPMLRSSPQALQLRRNALEIADLCRAKPAEVTA